MAGETLSTLTREQVSRIRTLFCDAGQGHVFTWWDELTSEERMHLYRQLTSIDLDLLKRLIEENLTAPRSTEARTLEPLPILRIPGTPEALEKHRRTRKEGEGIVRDGRCAVFVVAGSGDSDRDLHQAKGKYPITPVTGKSLFQLHTEKVLALRRRYDVDIPFFIMTSEDNHDETRAFFEENAFFGFPAEDLFFFSQAMLPMIDFSGKLLMKDKGSLYMTPDGHGGSIRSLLRSGALEIMEERGIDYIFYFQVDNPLVKILDPLFIGLHQFSGAEISAKAVRKRKPEERVGVLGKVNGLPGVVEYSDLTKEEMYARDESGALKFYAGNIAIHMLNVPFVRALGAHPFKLAFHRSERAVSTIDEKGEPVSSGGKNNALRFESFVFDALRHARKSMILEVPREEEFAPFKTIEGEDSAAECRRMVSRYYKTWLVKAGFTVDPDENLMVEISPLFAVDAGDFVEKVRRGRIFSERIFIE